MRASSAESLSITARNIYIKGRVQQGAGGKTEIKGFENLYIDGGSEYGLVSAAGALTIDGPGNITLTNDGSNAIIASRDSNGDLKLVGSTITLDGVGENSVGISGGKVGETSGAVSLKADVINVTAGKAIDISTGGNYSLEGTQNLNLTGDVVATNGDLSITSKLATVTGNISTAAESAFTLNGELQFKGDSANIGQLRRVLQIALLPSKADFIHLEGLCGATKST